MGAEAYATRDQAEDAFGFDIKGAGLLPVQLVMDNKSGKSLELVAKAHLQKKDFVQELIDLGEEGPLGLLTQELDGSPYLKMDRLTYLAGLIGLNELVARAVSNAGQ